MTEQELDLLKLSTGLMIEALKGIHLNAPASQENGAPPFMVFRIMERSNTAIGRFLTNGLGTVVECYLKGFAYQFSSALVLLESENRVCYSPGRGRDFERTEENIEGARSWKPN